MSQQYLRVGFIFTVSVSVLSAFQLWRCLFIYLLTAVLRLFGCTGFSLVAASGGYSPVTAEELLTAAAPLVCSTGSGAHRLWQLQHMGSLVAAPRL